MTNQKSATLFDGTEDEISARGSTPLMRQYYGIKDKHPNTVLLFRMGDFYETFDQDARLVAPILGLTLTKRANGKASSVALAGFPHHSLDTYLPKLVRSGHRVAICEQVEDPKTAKTIVKREVIEIVTPGVSFRDELLNPRRSNYLASACLNRNGTIAGVAFVDASTGEFYATEVPSADLDRVLSGIGPAEVLLPEGGNPALDGLRASGFLITAIPEWMFSLEFASSTLTEHFGTHSLKGFGLDELDVAVRAAGSVLQYLKDSQNGRLPPIRSIARYRTDSFMPLDAATRRNLDLDADDGRLSLTSILDETQTPMGARRLRSWILKPLVDPVAINDRLDAVSVLQRRIVRQELADILDRVGDIERLVVKNATGRSTPRDLVSLGDSLAAIGPMPEVLRQSESAFLQRTGTNMAPCHGVVDLIRSSIVDEPPASLSVGSVLRTGYDAELDELRDLTKSGKERIAAIQRDEAERTGISSLKVGYNRVFGYYLEVTNTHKEKVPDYFIRKQTLVNAERYITPGLKELEEKILSAQERIESLEAELFESVRSAVDEHAEAMLHNSDSVSIVDALLSFASVAAANQYTRPIVGEGRRLKIEDGRHPVVEASLEPGDQFIPNSVSIDPDTEQILVITGPNMAGKSVVLRQTGLIVLMAQIGSFVPATRAELGVVDRIFTRVGASDNLSAGESTFLVEMNEAANILNNATPRSLILLDEVGRGTSTFDGLSIAWAIVEYLHETGDVAAKTMFATHYHELNELAARLDRIANFRVLVQEHGGKVIFLRKLVRGGADHSYGIEVARMAGLPEIVIARAREVLLHLERAKLVVDAPGTGDGAHSPATVAPSPAGIDAFHPESFERVTGEPVNDQIAQRIKSADVNSMTPVEALVLISELSALARDHA